MQLNIEFYLVLLLYSLFVACFSLFFDFLLTPGMIFSRFATFMNEHVHDKGRLGEFIYKVTGGCVYCTNPYVSALFWSLVFGWGSVVSIVFFLLHLGINNVLLQLYYIYIYGRG